MIDNAEDRKVESKGHGAIVTGMDGGALEKGTDSLVKRASLAAAVGWTAGLSQEGRGIQAPLRFFDPVPVRMATSPVLDAWVVLARMVRLGTPPHLVAAQYLDHWRYPAGAAGFGLANLGRGVPPPLCGALDNPLSQDASAMGRAAFWGLAYHGQPSLAVSAALYDASFDHDRDGVWCAAAVAWLAAQTSPLCDFRSLVASLAEFLPAESAFSGALSKVLDWLGKPDGFVHGTNAVAGLKGAALTLAASLLASGGPDFGACVGAAVTASGDRATAGLVTGVLAALRFGDVPDDWVSPLGAGYIAGSGLRQIEPPQTLEDFAEMVVGTNLHLAPPVPEAEPLPEALPSPEHTETPEPEALQPATEEAAPEPVPDQEPEPGPSFEVAKLDPDVDQRLKSTSPVCMARLEGVDLEAVYIDHVAIVPGQALKLDLRFRASGPEEVITTVAVSVPSGWQVASRATEFRAQPGRMTSFPTVVQSPADWNRTPEALTVQVNDTRVGLPLLARDGWAWVGPMLNGDGSGLDQVFHPERGQERDQTFSDRSSMPVRWKAFDGDLERCVGGTPGVVYLAADVDFRRPGRYDLVCGAEGGVKVWVDGKLAVSANDSRGVDLASPGAFRGEFVTAGVSRVLIKLVRGKVAMSGLTFVVTSDDGSIVFPVVRDVLTTP